MKRATMAVVILTTLAGCGGGSVTAPTDVPEPTPAAPVAPPALMDGYFSTPRAAGAWTEGQTYVVIPSWGDDAQAAAAALSQRHAFALVSAHHCFSGKRAEWDACWAKTRAWMAPLEATGRVLGVYVIDEPLHNGVSHGAAAAAVARVRADGYRTMVAETYSMYAKTLRETGLRLDFGADWYGLTAYDTKPEWVADRYREDGRLNVVFCSSDDDADGRRLAATARARGLFRWSLDMGAAAHSMPRRLP